MALLKTRLLRRVALAWFAAVAASPVSAFALLPWRGAGACTAFDAPCVRMLEADFRDYSPASQADYASLAANPAHSATAASLDSLYDSEIFCEDLDPAGEDLAQPYDWSAVTSCGPTDWDCSMGRSIASSESAPSVARTAAAVARLLPIPTTDFVDWDAMGATLDAVAARLRTTPEQATTARAGVKAGLRTSAQVAASELSGALDLLGRHCLGAAESLERFAGSEAAAPQEDRSANARGNLGL
jgi:hypothetical protein